MKFTFYILVYRISTFLLPHITWNCRDVICQFSILYTKVLICQIHCLLSTPTPNVWNRLPVIWQRPYTAHKVRNMLMLRL